MVGFPGMSFAPPTQRASPDWIRRRTAMGGGHEAIPPAQHHQQSIPGRDGGAAAVRADGLRAGALSARALRREVCAGAARKPGDHRGRAFQSVPPPSRGRRASTWSTRPASRFSASAASWSTSSCPACSAGPGRSPTSRSTGSISTSRFSATEASISPRSWTAWLGRYTAVSSGERPAAAVALAARPAPRWEADVQRPLGSNASTTPVAPINLEVLNLATLPDRHGRYAITAAVPDGGTITWHGDVSLLPTASAGELEVKGVKLATAWAFVRDELRLAEPDGSVDVAMRYRFGYQDRQATLGLDDIRAQVSGLALRARGGGDPILALDTIAASGGRLDLATRELVVPSIELASGSVTVMPDAGRPNPARSTASRRSGSGARSRERRRPRPRRGRFVVETVKARDVQLALDDPSYEQPIVYDAHVASATVRDITNDGKAPMRFEAAVRVAQGGTVDGSGTIAQSFDGIEARVEMQPGRAGATPPPARPLCHARSQVRPRIRVRASRLPGARSRGRRSWPAARSPSATCW